MVRISTELADATRRVLSSNKVTLRDAETRTGIHYTSISQMTKGRIPMADHIIRFADAFDEDVPTWLEMCGHQEIANAFRKMQPKPEYGSLEHLLEDVPLPERSKAIDDARRFIQGWILPRYEDAAA